MRASLASIQGHSLADRVCVANLEDLLVGLLASLPRSSLLNIQKKIVPLLQLDVVGVSFFLSIPTLDSDKNFGTASPDRGRPAHIFLSAIKDTLTLRLGQSTLAHPCR